MALTVTNSFNNTDSWDANKVNTNFSDITSWANGGITTANIAGSAGITNAQLANSSEIFVLNADCNSGQYAGSVLGILMIPFIGSDTWTVLGYSYYTTDAGAGDGSFNIRYYTRTGTSFPTLETSILGTTTIDRYDNSTSNSVGLGRGSLNVDITTTSTKTGFIVFEQVTAGTGVMSATTDRLTFSLLIKRKNGLGSF